MFLDFFHEKIPGWWFGTWILYVPQFLLGWWSPIWRIHIFFRRGWNHPPDPENSRSMGTCSMAFDFPAEDMSNALQVPNPYAPRLLHPEPNGPNGPNGQARGDMTCQVSWSIRYFCWWVNIGDYIYYRTDLYSDVFFSATLGIDFLTNQYNGMPSLDVVFMAHLLNRVCTRWWPPSDVCWFIQPTKDVCIYIYVYNCIYIYINTYPP